jgi:hypothetical protein
MRNLDSCRCWRCTFYLCKVRNRFLVNFWNRTILVWTCCIYNIISIHVGTCWCYYYYKQGNRKVSVHLVITIQKVTSNLTLNIVKSNYLLYLLCWLKINKQNTLQVMFKVPSPVSRHVLTRLTLFSNTVFSTLTMLYGKWLKLFKILLLVFLYYNFRYAETFWSPCIIELRIISYS